MGNWTEAFFHFRPLRFDRQVLTRLDECFEAIGYRAMPVECQGKTHKPQDRGQLLDPGAPIDRMLCFGYSLSGQDDESLLHLMLFPSALACMTRLWLAPHTDELNFRCANGDPDVADLAKSRPDEVARAQATMDLFLSIHDCLDAFWSRLQPEYDDEPFATLGNCVPHEVLAPEGKAAESVRLFQHSDGQWLCPVCYEACGEVAPWIMPEPESFATGSGLRCPTCRTQFGVDDLGLVNSRNNLVMAWDCLRRTRFSR